MEINSLFNVLLIIFGFGLLIGIHELGHFLAAKWAGIRTQVFAIGMGPVFMSWRKGIGLTFKSTRAKVISQFGKDANDMTEQELKDNGISETEYSLRYLPIGGFVTMLGQEDGKPDQISDDPRSYNNCPIGKRMIVVSAGVIMNIILAAVFFFISFQVGVKFAAPVIGQIVPHSPASKAVAVEDDRIRLSSGDTVVSINGKPVTTFTDIQIAGAMATPNEPLNMVVQSYASKELHTFVIQPDKVTQDGLYELGVYPSASLTLRAGQSAQTVNSILEGSDLSASGILPGMTMVEANHQNIETWEQFNHIVQLSDGNDVKTIWKGSNTTVEIDVPVSPSFEIIYPAGLAEDKVQDYEHGILGLVPLSKISAVLPTSLNKGVLQKDDLILSVGNFEAPRMGQVRNYLQNHEDESISMQLLRDGNSLHVEVKTQQGKLGVMLVNAWDSLVIAQPILQQLQVVNNELEVQQTAISGKQILPKSKLLSVSGKEIHNWEELRRLLSQSETSTTLAYQTPSGSLETIVIPLNKEIRRDLNSLGWSTSLLDPLFDPLYVIKHSGGNPITALKMGFEETVDMVVMTYLTIDRLFRRTVGVDQLRGPIGIIHIGSKIADRGFSYLLFFLAIISVNLAVLNFLPLPIVDGGLFLYLVYEKLVGRPPSIAFQNAAAIFGLGLIGMLFVVTFYNDIMRLIG